MQAQRQDEDKGKVKGKRANTAFVGLGFVSFTDEFGKKHRMRFNSFHHVYQVGQRVTFTQVKRLYIDSYMDQMDNFAMDVHPWAMGVDYMP